MRSGLRRRGVVLVVTVVVATTLALTAPSAGAIGTLQSWGRVEVPVSNGAGGDLVLDGDTFALTTGSTVGVYVRTGSGWALQQQLAPAVPVSRFGADLALDGDTLVVGADGRAVVFVRSGTTWAEQQVLVPADANTQVGTRVAIDGDTVIVAGEVFASFGASSSGGANVFVRSGATWTEQADLDALVPPCPVSGCPGLGNAVALFGDELYIGADQPLVANSSTVARFTRTGTTWTRQADLTVATDDGWFAFDVSTGTLLTVTGLLGNTYEDGSVRVWSGAGSAFAPVQTIRPPAGHGLQLNPIVRGDRIAVGSFAPNESGTTIYERDGATFAPTARLAAEPGRGYGQSAFGDDELAVHSAGTGWTAARVTVLGDATVGSPVDLGIEQSAPANAPAGDELTYEVTVTNHGTTEASTATVTDDLPGGTTFRAVAGPGAGCLTPDVDHIGVVSCTWWAGLAPGASASLTVTVAVEPGFSGDLVNEVAVSGPEDEIDPVDNAASATTAIAAATPTSIRVTTDLPRDAISGRNLAWTVALMNTGAAPTTPPVRVIDTVGAGTTVLGIEGDGWSCETAGQQLTCRHDDALAPGATTTLAIVASVDAATGAPVANTATLQTSAAIIADGPATTSVSRTVLSPTAAAPTDLAPAVRPPFLSYGAAMAVDGDTLVVGAPGLGSGGQQSSGGVYVFTRSAAGAWTQQATLVPADPVTNQQMGASVAIDGDTIVAGAPAFNNLPGSAYVFVRTGSSWTQQAKLVAPDGNPQDSFGKSVAVDGDLALVGAPGNAVDGTAAGAGYTFVRSGGSWTLGQRFARPGTATYTRFGSAVVLDGANAAVGASGYPDGGGYTPGAVVTYTRSGPSLTETGLLIRPNGELYSRGENAGRDLALDGDTLVVSGGDPNGSANDIDGGAWIYRRRGSGWVLDRQVLGSAAAAQRVGRSIAIADGTILVTDRSDSAAPKVLVFEEFGGFWVQQPSIAAGPATSATWAKEVATTRGEVLVGDPTASGPTAYTGVVRRYAPVVTADLRATITAAAVLRSGQSTTTTATATNDGPAAAIDVRLTVPVPAGAGFLTATPSAGGACTTPPFATSGTVTCIWAGATAAGTSRSIRTAMTAGAGPTLQHAATADSITGDPDVDDHHATATTTVGAGPPILIPGIATSAEGDAGATTIAVPVFLSTPALGTVTATWQTFPVPGAPGHQATAGADYAPQSGTVTFAPGATTSTIELAVTGDADVEPDEYVMLRFGDPTGGAVIGGYWGLGFVAIANDDG